MGWIKQKSKSSYSRFLLAHYGEFWGNPDVVLCPPKGMDNRLGDEFRVLEYRPTRQRNSWIYATCGLGEPAVSNLELYLVSPWQHQDHQKLLAAVSHYHLTGESLGLHHTINFGQPWMTESCCDHGFVSLPYLEPPAFKSFVYNEKTIDCLWLIPVTREEKGYAVSHGVGSLECRFEEAEFNYMDPARASVV